MNDSMQNRKVLIVDDEMDIRFLLGAILLKKNIQTVFASSLSEADNILENKGNFDCIFLDNLLPDGLGVNHIRQIKRKYPQAKIVMITAHDNQTDRQKATTEGADYFIGKPFSSEIILKTIDRLAI
ncbi:MAG TPA: response regulator [Chitinophagaceae bacterium]|nr:response regulator [Chitinophagaceae bacterium]